MASSVSGRLGMYDFELWLTQEYPQRDYIVQFDESDLAFISRLCENYGIFYYFTHDNGRDVAVFGDSRVAFPHAAGPGSVAYRPASGLANAGVYHLPPAGDERVAADLVSKRELRQPQAE